MKKIIYIKYCIYILGITINYSYAQNIVPNSSFEDTTQCPFIPSQIYYAFPWTDPNNGTSDFYSACNNTGTGLVGVPYNIGGYQNAKTGVGYAGLMTYSQGANLREYIQAKLFSQLESNKEYCLEFYVSLADSQAVACNTIGAYFSDTAITAPFWSILYVTPQISNNTLLNPLTDKIAWIKVSGTFIANGTENYITIGNFLDDANSDTVYIGGGCIGCNASGYYIDDVSVICCNCDTTSANTISALFIPNTFTPNEDGKNDKFEVHGQNIKTFKGRIYNRWGESLYEWNELNEGWDGKYKGNNVSDGIYIYVIKAMGADAVEYNRRGTLLMVR